MNALINVVVIRDLGYYEKVLLQRIDDDNATTEIMNLKSISILLHSVQRSGLEKHEKFSEILSFQTLYIN